MAATPKDTSLIDLPTLRAWLKQATPVQTAIAASPAPTVSTATVASGTGLTVGKDIVITTNGQTYLRSLLANAANALHWTPDLPLAPSAGDVVANALEDRILVTLIDGVSDWLERQTGRWFVNRPYTEIFSGDGRGAHFTRYAPIASISSVVTDAGATPLDASAYYVDAERGYVELHPGRLFTKGNPGNCRIVGMFGCENTTRMDSAIAAALDLIKVIYDRTASGTVSISSLNAGGMGISIVAGLPDTLKMQIAALKDVRGRG